MDLTGARWRKSSFSSDGNNSACVEVAVLPGERVAVRDTKDRSRTPSLYPAAAWRAFLTAVRAGEFD